MKLELFEVTFDVTPVIFATEESAGRAAASMSRGMVAKLCNGKLTYAMVEPQVRRVVLDILQPRYKKMIPAFHAELEAAQGGASLHKELMALSADEAMGGDAKAARLYARTAKLLAQRHRKEGGAK